MNLQLGREILSNLQLAESREWLVTNGIGGYAAGAIAGTLTRCYHGLLIAALQPPVARTLLLTKLEETVHYNEEFYELYTNRWADGTIAPHGYLNIESFHLEGTIPVWNFAVADALLEKRIWMEQGENNTYIRYTYKRGSPPLTLSLKGLVNYRDHHSSTHTADREIGYVISSLKSDISNLQGIKIQAFTDAKTLYLLATQDSQQNDFSWEINHTWYYNFALAVEKYRGLDATEDHLHAVTGRVTLQQGDSLTIIASTERKTEISNNQDEKIIKRERELIDLFYSQNNLTSAPSWIEQLVLAADQFIVDRPLIDNPEGKTIIAGYPWFTDWGRDTMISLSGLTISTGRYNIAQTILRTFAKYIDKGMLPNVFPDAGATPEYNPEYNTVDATLWYFEALRAYYCATKDQEFLGELFPLLVEIIDWHIKGTRYNIRMDDDGLLYAGETGVQLTWMDAKVGDWVVTPRIGKPIEVNALWYNALVCMAYFSQILGKSDRKYREMAEKTRSHFSRFWYEVGGYCYDVIDTPDGNDTAFRPNQIFAVSLPEVKGIQEFPLQKTQQKAVVDKVGQMLLTSYGLRSLSPSDPNYVGVYGGNQLQRDGSYHQGTTWSWLIGHFVQAHLRVYQNSALALSFLEPMANHLQNGCIGTISEIFDGDTPFTPRGCFAQAWSIAEVLRVWLMVNPCGDLSRSGARLASSSQ